MADGIRTRDHRDHNPGLYQLSYRHRGADRIAGLFAASVGAGVDVGAPERVLWSGRRAKGGCEMKVICCIAFRLDAAFR